ncbi:uncharacterized protein [Lolium perenne]|uniref:uncharacterized protein isoform X4 n=1 Tax=Lolium perenne TaxID=4522 RepID=UPI003A99CB0F
MSSFSRIWVVVALGLPHRLAAAALVDLLSNCVLGYLLLWVGCCAHLPVSCSRDGGRTTGCPKVHPANSPLWPAREEDHEEHGRPPPSPAP